jgi:hypothetical protein
MAGASVLAMAIGAQAAPQKGMGAPAHLTLLRHAPAEVACKQREPAFDMSVDTELVGGTSHAGPNGEATGLAGGSAQAAPVAAESQGRFRLNGQKYASPAGARTEAGVGLSLGSHVSLQLNYARTASAPMMAYPNDNGILARLRIGF